MCGIFGYVNLNSPPEALLRIMAAEQIHRGPDSVGYHEDGTLGMGIRRLSVIDLVTGDQPISNEDKTIWIVCNGEIYNYVELTAQLKAEGHQFTTASDVECIVHLYENHGIDCVNHLNGMFSFALFDQKKGKLFLVRDRVGIKPLYYAKVDTGLLFASELRSILASGLVGTDLDWNAISSFLDLFYIPTPLTPFLSIRKLEPGCYMTCDSSPGGEIHIRPYWDLGQVRPSEPHDTIENIADRLEHLFVDAHRLQLRSDVPVCIFLSGGVDSSAVAAFSAEHVSSPLRTFHVCFEGAQTKQDERKKARLVAERYGTKHTEVLVGREDFKTLIPRLLWHLEEPFADLAAVPTFVISEMARREATVCLNGGGGDELFGGYAQHGYGFHVRRHMLSALDRMGIGSPIRRLVGASQGHRLWQRLFPAYIPPQTRRLPIKTSGAFHGDFRNRKMAEDIEGYLQSNVLFLLDKITMAVSLEGRVPLLDHRIVELAMSIPSTMKIRGQERKFIFKKLLERRLPPEVLYAKKEGFGAPLQDWLDDDTTLLLRKIVQNGHLRREGVLRGGDDIVDRLQVWELWRVACLELWIRIVAPRRGCPSGNTLSDFI